MEQLGIDVRLLLTQIVNFSILVFLLSKFLYKPIMKALKDRQSKIAEGLAWSEKAKREEERLDARKQEILKEARTEARKIIDEAKKQGQVEQVAILEKGKKEAAQMKKRMESEMEAKLTELSGALTDRTVDIAGEMVKKLLGEVLSSEDQHKLIIKQLKKIQQYHETKKA